jgi:hypothetical protein
LLVLSRRQLLLLVLYTFGATAAVASDWATVAVANNW